jgi:hypothetical protein
VVLRVKSQVVVAVVWDWVDSGVLGRDFVMSRVDPDLEVLCRDYVTCCLRDRAVRVMFLQVDGEKTDHLRSIGDRSSCVSEA